MDVVLSAYTLGSHAAGYMFEHLKVIKKGKMGG